MGINVRFGLGPVSVGGRLGVSSSTADSIAGLMIWLFWVALTAMAMASAIAGIIGALFGAAFAATRPRMSVGSWEYVLSLLLLPIALFCFAIPPAFVALDFVGLFDSSKTAEQMNHESVVTELLADGKWGIFMLSLLVLWTTFWAYGFQGLVRIIRRRMRSDAAGTGLGPWLLGLLFSLVPPVALFLLWVYETDYEFDGFVYWLVGLSVLGFFAINRFIGPDDSMHNFRSMRNARLAACVLTPVIANGLTLVTIGLPPYAP